MAPPAEVKANGITASRSLDVLIVGAGFGGLYQLHYLRKMGYKCKVVDNAGELGGIWYWNCYPGARVDSDTPLYEYSIEGLYKDWTWSERFPSWPELRKYFQYVDKKLDLSKDVELNTSVESAEFDIKSSRWNITLGGGEMVDCKYFVLCTGFAAKHYVPNFKGMENYKGIMHHTAKYPQGGLELKGKKVCVIGTGASGVQTIQEVGPEVDHLTVLQRTPNLCLPMNQHKLDPAVEQRLKKEGDYEKVFKYRRETFGGFHFDFLERNGDEDTAEQKRELYEKLWSGGGFRFWLGTYKDLLFDKKVNDTAYEFWAEKTRARINDPRKRDILAPTLDKQPHTFGTKRPSLEQRYYEVYNQDNVDIYSLKENPIETFTEKGIKLKNGENLEFDVIILATGFDSVTGGLVQIDIKGVDGVSLADKWSKGTWTYLGMTTANFPNMYFLYGPQGPTAFANGPTIVELQGDWIIDAIDYCEKNNKKTMDATAQSEAGWTKHVAELCDITLFPGTDSWYMGANIPGKPRESLNYAGGIPRYVRESKEVAEKGYTGFNFDTPYNTQVKA
ncbi:putative cyclopentanone 1,2-monooxygenase [Tricladium varicosporioides]|nr:putative cyclopentanone 1,2-monooxygenase [Hymenoscyphus varicosporioides]